MLADLFGVPYEVSRDFDAVFVLSGRYLFRYHQGSLSLNYTTT